MRPLGGEIEIKRTEYQEGFTDSGRSSLRLFLRQSRFKNKKILIPDFLCDIIIDVLLEEKIKYSFYHIDESFCITNETIKDKDFDILYVIHYFGNITKIEANITNKILLEDYVFHSNFQNILKHDKWYAYNSYRKISAAYDGSYIKTNLAIDFGEIQTSEAPFVIHKKLGKDIKYDYINNQKGTEEAYLKELFIGEKVLDEQKAIYKISNSSLGYLLSHNANHKERKKRYFLAQENLKNSLKLSPTFYSFFLIRSNDRDRLRKELIDKRIFLPIYWQSKYIETEFSKELLSVPLSEHFTDNEFLYMVTTIKKLMT